MVFVGGTYPFCEDSETAALYILLWQLEAASAGHLGFSPAWA